MRARDSSAPPAPEPGQARPVQVPADREPAGPGRPERAPDPADLERSGTVFRAVRPLLPALVAAAVLASGLVHLGLVDPDPLSPLSRAGLVVVLAVLVALSALLWVHPRTTRWAPDVVVGLTAGYSSLTLATALNGTPFPVMGLGGDYGYKVQAVSRFASTWDNADFTYRGLPSFYPPLQPYLAGRTSDLLDLSAGLTMKIVSIVFTALVPLLAYALWKRVVPRREAALLTLTALVVEVFIQTDSWVALFVVVPFWLDTVFGVRRAGVARLHPVAAGVLGALLFCTYYYYFFIMALTLPLLPLLLRWHPLREERPWRHRLTALGVAGALTSIYWLPLLLSMARAQEPQSLQNLWFQPYMADLPLPMFSASIVGVLQLLGLLHVVLTARKDPLSGGLATLLLASYAFYVLGLALATLGKPVLVFRTDYLLGLLLSVAGVRALLDLARLATARWPAVDARRVVLVAAVGLALSVGQTYMTTVMLSKHIPAAHDQPTARGDLPRHHTRAAVAPQTSVAELQAVVARGVPTSEPPVVLSANVDLLAQTDFYSFNMWTSHYAHPAGEFRSRLAFLRQLAAEQDAARFAALSAQNRFDSIDAFVLRTTSRGLRYGAADDDFPHGSEGFEVFFTRAQFDPDQFVLTELPGHLVAVRRAAA